MVKKIHINEDNNSFDIKAFRKYIENICENAVEDVEGQYPVQIVDIEFPTYNWEWAADTMYRDLEEARNRAIEALVDYEMLALLYNKEEYEV